MRKGKLKMHVANTIKNTLGHRALFMIGAKNILGSADSLSFKIGRNHRAINHIKITLTGEDLYTMTFSRMPSPKMLARGREPKIVSTHERLYFDMLKPVIEKVTGMYTSL